MEDGLSQIQSHINLFTIIITYYSSKSDLQPSAAIANQLPDQLITTQIGTIGPSFKFIIALTVLSMKLV